MKRPSSDPSVAAENLCTCPVLGKLGKDALCFLLDNEWDDGTPRQRATLTIFIEDSTVKLCLNDRENACSLFRSAPTLERALASMGEALKSPAPDWKPWQGKRKKS